MQGLLNIRAELTGRPDEATAQWHSKTLASAILEAGKAGATPGPDVVVLYKHRKNTEAQPYMTICPLPDTAWIDSPEWKHVLNTVLQDSGLKTHFRVYELVQTFEGNLPPKPGRAKGLLEASIQLPQELDGDFHQWYRIQHLDMLTMIPGYRRTSRYELLPLKAFPNMPQNGDDGIADLKHEALHEFEDVKFITDEHLDATGRTEMSSRMLSSFTAFARNDWILVDVNGNDSVRLGVFS